jgi:hypothetical protein
VQSQNKNALFRGLDAFLFFILFDYLIYHSGEFGFSRDSSMCEHPDGIIEEGFSFESTGMRQGTEQGFGFFVVIDFIFNIFHDTLFACFTDHGLVFTVDTGNDSTESLIVCFFYAIASDLEGFVVGGLNPEDVMDMSGTEVALSISDREFLEFEGSDSQPSGFKDVNERTSEEGIRSDGFVAHMKTFTLCLGC